MSLPYYCKAPNKAEAELAISGTRSSAAAVEVVAITPFIAKKNRNNPPYISLRSKLTSVNKVSPANMAVPDIYLVLLSFSYYIVILEIN